MIWVSELPQIKRKSVIGDGFLAGSYEIGNDRHQKCEHVSNEKKIIKNQAERLPYSVSQFREVNREFVIFGKLKSRLDFSHFSPHHDFSKFSNFQASYNVDFSLLSLFLCLKIDCTLFRQSFIMSWREKQTAMLAEKKVIFCGFP